jgi:hypothetical protein
MWDGMALLPDAIISPKKKSFKKSRQAGGGDRLKDKLAVKVAKISPIPSFPQ